MPPAALAPSFCRNARCLADVAVDCLSAPAVRGDRARTIPPAPKAQSGARFRVCKRGGAWSLGQAGQCLSRFIIPANGAALPFLLTLSREPSSHFRREMIAEMSLLCPIPCSVCRMIRVILVSSRHSHEAERFGRLLGLFALRPGGHQASGLRRSRMDSMPPKQSLDSRTSKPAANRFARSRCRSGNCRRLSAM